MGDYLTLDRIRINCPAPSDPRKGLDALKASTQRLRTQNDRMVVGLKVGFRVLESRAVTINGNT